MSLAPATATELGGLTTFSGLGHNGPRASVAHLRGVPFPCIDAGSVRYLLVAAPPDGTLRSLLHAVGDLPSADYTRQNLSQVVFAIAGPAMLGKQETIGLGVQATSLADAAARLVGLPDGWRAHSTDLLRQTLAPITDLGGRPVRLRGHSGAQDNIDDAGQWLQERLGTGDSQSPQHTFVYIRAEAGKGKSTLLAGVATDLLHTGRLPVPAFVPLRLLPAGRGVSWEEIVRLLGVVGDEAARALAAAVKAGIVVPLLDGIDEVAGRYDPALVRELLSIVRADLMGPGARVVLSGRSTEATQLDVTEWTILGLELPESNSSDFSNYVDSTVRHTISKWAETLVELPPPLTAHLQADSLDDSPPAEHQIEQLDAWIAAVFDEFGKDRSLFFVQSLAALGRDRQLSGNHPLLVRGSKNPPWRPPVLDVCLLAAAMACVREQTKVEAFARTKYTAPAQLQLLAAFAVCSAATGSLRSLVAKPNELARTIFDVDPINANELFTSIVRQNQKHALLFSSGTSAAVGDWTPDFLSSWIRSALLVWAWMNQSAVQKIATSVVREVVATAPQVRLAFSEIFPEFNDDALRDLADELARQTTAGNSDASANHVVLWAALTETRRSQIPVPARIMEGADLNDAEFVGLKLENWFSAEMALLNGAIFDGCEFVGVAWRNSDFTGVEFRRCTFRDVTWDGCDGPIVLEDCDLVSTSVCDMRSLNHPAVTFVNCRFDVLTRIVQAKPAFPDHRTRAVAAFVDCECTGAVEALLGGEWLGIHDAKQIGVKQIVPGDGRDVTRDCLRAMLRAFFPPRAGAAGQLQARGYIRTSALGRGLFPAGAPSGSKLRGILESVGFTSGGRTEHIYAPWASVNGAGENAVALRNEFLAFLRTGNGGQNVDTLLRRIAAEWQR